MRPYNNAIVFARAFLLSSQFQAAIRRSPGGAVKPNRALLGSVPRLTSELARELFLRDACDCFREGGRDLSVTRILDFRGHRTSDRAIDLSSELRRC